MSHLTTSSDTRLATTHRTFGLTQQPRLSPTEQLHQDHQIHLSHGSTYGKNHYTACIRVQRPNSQPRLAILQ